MIRIYDYINKHGYLSLIKSSYIDDTQAINIVKTSDFQRQLAEYIQYMYSSLPIRPRLLTISDYLNDSVLADVIKDICTSVYLSNEYKYKTLYDTIIAEYNPIENYSMTEDIEVDYLGGSRTELDISGTEDNTRTLSGSEIDTFAKSGVERNTTNFNGSESTSDIIGATNTTNAHSITPYDNNTLVISTSDNEQSQEHTNTNTKSFDNRNNVDELEFINRSDSNTKEYVNRVDKNITSYSNRKDTTSTAYTDRKDTTHHIRKGNIGVTTTQQMLQSSRDLAEFSLIRVVAHDILKRIALVVY